MIAPEVAAVEQKLVAFELVEFDVAVEFVQFVLDFAESFEPIAAADPVYCKLESKFDESIDLMNTFDKRIIFIYL